MKNFTILSTIAVAALTVAAGSASAQTYKAQIPMAFHAGRTLVAPGAYNFEIRIATNGHDVLMIRRSDDSKLVAYLIPIPGSDAPRSWREKGNPIIAFECAGRDCTLRQFWRGQEVTAFAFPAPKLSPAASERASIVTFALTKTE